jgi:CheY-like chemotaxis protein
VDGDADRLAQVVSYLLTNAARYTDPGGHLQVSAAAHGDDVDIVVRDDGMGIPLALLPHLFDAFTQGSQPLDRRTGGLGLGLAIVRSLVALHGGTVEASSDGPGRGSELRVRLPRAAPGEAPVRPAVVTESRTPASRGHVLVVDDNVDAADLLELSLTAFGFRTERAYDAAEALERMARAAPHAAVLDIGLPGMDGLELARRIRATPELRDMRLVALTGYSQPSDRAQTREAGFDKHLVKPVDIYELERTLSRLLERH